MGEGFYKTIGTAAALLDFTGVVARITRSQSFYIVRPDSFVVIGTLAPITMSAKTLSYGKLALIVCFIACACDFVVTYVIGLRYRGYNALTDSQSDLGTASSPVAVYMNSWEVLLGLLLLTCTWCLYRTGFFRTRLQKSVLWLLAIYALGEGVGSGLFPFNHVRHQLTATGWVHSICSGIGITAMVVLSFVMVKLFPKVRLPGLHKVFVASALSGMVFILLCLLSRKNFIEFVGLWQRLYILAYYFMLFAFTLHLSKLQMAGHMDNKRSLHPEYPGTKK